MIELSDIDTPPFNPDHSNSFISTFLNACHPSKSSDLVSNVKTTFSMLCIDTDVCAISINKKEYDNSAVCSPYTTYITLPLHELKKIRKIRLKCAVFLNALIMGFICRISRLNQIVQVNNHLTASLHYSAMFSNNISDITHQLTQRYPKHAILFTQVNQAIDADLLTALKTNNYTVFHDRTSHIFFPHHHFQKRTDTKNDFLLLEKSPYTQVPHDALLPSDAARLCELYHLLFIDKHSASNPHFTEKYFQLALQNHWHHYTALRNENGQIDAFCSWVVRDNHMICGPMGYDTTVDIKKGLYRQATALYLKHAYDNQFIFNMGGGSDQFKQNRGSTKTLVYTAVYLKHLPFYRHIPWKLFQWMFNTFFKKIIEQETF